MINPKMLAMVIRGYLPKDMVIEETNIDPDSPELQSICTQARESGKVLRMVRAGENAFFAFVPADFPKFLG